MLRSVDQPRRATAEDEVGATSVRHFRQVLLWPLRLMPLHERDGQTQHRQRPWELLRDLGDASPWR
jgi:hypothetical protein